MMVPFVKGIGKSSGIQSRRYGPILLDLILESANCTQCLQSISTKVEASNSNAETIFRVRMLIERPVAAASKRSGLVSAERLPLCKGNGHARKTYSGVWGVWAKEMKQKSKLSLPYHAHTVTEPHSHTHIDMVVYDLLLMLIYSNES